MSIVNSVRPTIVARELCHQANLTRSVQRITIQSVVMIARPEDRPRQVANTWRVQYTRYCWERSYSPMFAEQRSQDQLAMQQRLQAHADEALLSLQQATIQEEHQIAGCLMVLCAAPDIGSVTVPWENVYQTLYKLGFRQDDRLGELASMNLHSELRWLAGQTMSAIAHGANTLVGMRHLLALNQRAQEWLQRNPETVPSRSA